MRSFEDRWEGGVQVYVQWMRERMMELRRILKPTGSLYLHCDWHAAHYLKQMMDDVFGSNRFQNEIIWYYRGGGVSPRRWGRRHDTIFFYTKGDEWTFNVDPVRDEYSPESMERLQYTARAFRGDRVYDTYQPHPEGKHPDDVWQIQPIMPSAKERLGYPTQKPERLLERIVLASSNEGDIVLDPFAGCGTTLVVAERWKRQWIGIDISPTAVGLMKRRMRKASAAVSVKLVGMPVTEDELKALKPFEFQNWIIQQIHGTHSPRRSGDMGIDGYTFFEHSPVQVKQSERVGRQVVDNFQTAIERSGKSKGMIFAFSFTRGAYEEAARAKSAKGMEIQLVTIAELLAEQPSDIVTPTPAGTGDLFPEEALPEARDKDARPSAQELIDSVKGRA